MIYNYNNLGSKTKKRITKSVLITFIFGNTFLFVVQKSLVRMARGNIVNCYIACGGLVCLMIYLHIELIKSVIDHNKIIRKLVIKDSILKFETMPVLWKKSKTINVCKSDITTSKTSIDWVKGKTDRTIIKGATAIKLPNKKEYFLVLDFFDEYETMVKNFT